MGLDSVNIVMCLESYLRILQSSGGHCISYAIFTNMTNRPAFFFAQYVQQNSQTKMVSYSFCVKCAVNFT